MLDVTQGELAGMLRVDPESMSGAIKRLRARGLVLPGRRSLHVVNIRARGDGEILRAALLRGTVTA